MYFNIIKKIKFYLKS